MKEGQCFGCYDLAMCQYHGTEYFTAEGSWEYIESYQSLGEPQIKCVSCGNVVIYTEDGDKWKEVLIKANGY